MWVRVGWRNLHRDKGMIESYSQYLITKQWRDKFLEASRCEYVGNGAPRWVRGLMRCSYEEQAKELQEEMNEYDRGLMYE